MNDFEKFQRSNSIKWIAVLMAMILLFAIAGATLGILVAHIENQNQEQPIVAIGDNNVAMNEDNVYAMPKNLSFSANAMAASANHSVSVTLQATVLPAEAENKAVDWNVAWANVTQHESEAVTDFVTVTPKSDGSTTATVTCIKAFGDDTISITVTTRDGGFTATCIVRYVGAPTTIDIATTGATSKTVAGWNKNMVEVKCGTVYNFPINLNNEFGLVGNAYTPEYEFSVVAHGSIVTTQTVSDINGNVTAVNHPVYEMQSADTRSYNGTIYTFFPEARSICTNCVFEIKDGALIVTPRAMASSYRGESYDRTGSSIWVFESYVENKMPYATVTITETKSGLSKTIDIIVGSGVQSVSLSQTSIDI